MKIKLFTLPNILTLCNLLCGAAAAVAALRFDNLQWPLLFIVAAAVFDFLDGFAARLFKSYSPLGFIGRLCQLWFRPFGDSAEHI